MTSTNPYAALAYASTFEEPRKRKSKNKNKKNKKNDETAVIMTPVLIVPQAETKNIGSNPWKIQGIPARVPLPFIQSLEKEDQKRRREKEELGRKQREEARRCKRQACSDKEPHPYTDCEFKQNYLCPECKKFGHTEEECLWCDNCEKFGHTDEECEMHDCPWCGEFVRHASEDCYLANRACKNWRCKEEAKDGKVFHIWDECERNITCVHCNKPACGHLPKECPSKNNKKGRTSKHKGYDARLKI